MPFKKVLNKQLGDLLVERGLLTAQQLQQSLAVQREKGGLIGEVLVSLGYVKEEDIAQALTAQYGFPYLPLGNYEIGVEIAQVIPRRVAQQYMLIPVDKIGKNLTVAMSNPLNMPAIEDVEFLTGCSVQVFVSTSSDIKEAIERYYSEK